MDRAGYCVFAVLFVLRLAGHGMWRDEVQAWMIARASATPLDLVHNLRYEGHPALWYLLLWVPSRLTGDPGAMQILQGLIGLVLLGLLWLRSPFSTVEKVLLSLSYFFAFEYLVMSRAYGLAVALLFTFLAARRSIERRPWLGWLLLGLVANTHVLFAMTAVALGAAWLWERRGTAARHVPGLALFAGGLAVAVVVAVRPNGAVSHDPGNPTSLRHFTESLAATAKAFVPISAPWALPYENPGLPPLLGAIAGLLALAAVAWYLRPRPAACLLFAGLAVALLAFFHLVHLGVARHAGILFVFVVALVWLYRSDGQGHGSLGPAAIFTALLALNAFGGAKSIVVASLAPFSSARDAAGWIAGHGLRDACWIGVPDTATSPIAGYLDRPLHYAECACAGTYLRWRERVPVPATPGAREHAVRTVMDRSGLDACHVVTTGVLAPGASRLRLEPLARIDGGVARGEGAYFMYRATRLPGTGE